jgi:hypothetical protein
MRDGRCAPGSGCYARGEEAGSLLRFHLLGPTAMSALQANPLQSASGAVRQKKPFGVVASRQIDRFRPSCGEPLARGRVDASVFDPRSARGARIRMAGEVAGWITSVVG